MTSFIEIPMLYFGGNEAPSIYVNTADIISLRAEYDSNTKLEIRDQGSDGMSATRVSYIPLGAFLNTLGELAKYPGVKSWADDFKAAHREPAQERARAAADRERSAARQGA